MDETTVKRGFRAPRELKSAAESAAADRGESLSTVLRRILSDYVAEPRYVDPFHDRVPSQPMVNVPFRVRFSEYSAAAEKAAAERSSVSAVLREGLAAYVASGHAGTGRSGRRKTKKEGKKR